jgi:hypothetical protein
MIALNSLILQGFIRKFLTCNSQKRFLCLNIDSYCSYLEGKFMKILLVLMMMLSSFTMSVHAGLVENNFFTKKRDAKKSSPGCKKVGVEKVKLRSKDKFKEKLFWCQSCKDGAIQNENPKDFKFLWDDVEGRTLIEKKHYICTKPEKEKKFFYCDPSTKNVVEVVAKDESEASTKSNGNKIYKKERKAKKDPNCKVVKVACTVADPIGSFLKDAQLDKKQVKDYKKACKAEKKNFDRDGDVCSCKAEPLKVACTVADAIGSFAKDAQLSKDQVKDYKKACKAEKKKFDRKDDICSCQGKVIEPACTVVDAIGSFAKDAQLGKKEVKEYKRACKEEKGSFSRDKDAKTCGCTKGSEPKFYVCVPGTKDEIREIVAKNEKKARKVAKKDKSLGGKKHPPLYQSRDEAVVNFPKDCPPIGGEVSADFNCYYCDPESYDKYKGIEAIVNVSSKDFIGEEKGNISSNKWNEKIKSDDDVMKYRFAKKIVGKSDFNRMYKAIKNKKPTLLNRFKDVINKDRAKFVACEFGTEKGESVKKRALEYGIASGICQEAEKGSCSNTYGIQGVKDLGGFNTENEAKAAIEKARNDADTSHKGKNSIASRVEGSVKSDGDVFSLITAVGEEKCGWTATLLKCPDKTISDIINEKAMAEKDISGLFPVVGKNLGEMKVNAKKTIDERKKKFISLRDTLFKRYAPPAYTHIKGEGENSFEIKFNNFECGMASFEYSVEGVLNTVKGEIVVQIPKGEGPFNYKFEYDCSKAIAEYKNGWLKKVVAGTSTTSYIKINVEDGKCLSVIGHDDMVEPGKSYPGSTSGKLPSSNIKGSGETKLK